MNKIQGLISDYSPIKREGTQIVIGYGMQPIDGEEATWYEVSLPAGKYPLLSLDDVKKAIIGDINAQTDEKILSGFVWTPEGGQPINVWLSEENQRNFSEAQRVALMVSDAILPVTFKMGEDENETAVYHEFTTAEELTGFYLASVAYINQCLQQGWAEKDSIDWAPYEALFPAQQQEQPVAAA